MARVESWLPAFAPDALVRLLFRLRGLRPEGSIERFMADNGFVVLERTARTYGVGLVARQTSERNQGAGSTRRR